MLTNDPFYWGTIRKVIVAFGSLFSDLHIVRTAPDLTTKSIKVPLAYGPKEKWIYRRKQNPMPGTDDQVEMTLPRMSYEIGQFNYDSARKLTSTGRNVKALVDTNETLRAQFNPVPYNIGFTVHIMTKTLQDGLMIIEQILPFFTPDYTVSVIDIPELNLEKDISIVYNGITGQDTWDESFQERRTITWELSFTAKAYLYPPVNLTKVNLQTTVNFLVDGETNELGALPGIVITPNPTTATADSDYTITVTSTTGVVRVLISPSTALLVPFGTKTFTINIINSVDTSRTLTLTPDIGTVVSTGLNTVLYTAPMNVPATQEIELKVTSTVDVTKFSTAIITIEP